MQYEKAINFLKEHSYFHDSIVDKYIITNSTFIDKKNSIVFKKNGWNDVEILLSSQKGYKVKIRLIKARRMAIHELHELIIFKVKLDKKNDKIQFSLTGGFGENHTWFEAENIEIEEI